MQAVGAVEPSRQEMEPAAVWNLWGVRGASMSRCRSSLPRDPGRMAAVRLENFVCVAAPALPVDPKAVRRLRFV